MMTLVPCDTLIGNIVIFEPLPRYGIYTDVLYVPTGRAKRDEGLFDHEQALIPDAGYFRNHPDRTSIYKIINPLPHDRFDYAPDGVQYLFIGALTGHYGHFITNSLARLWALNHVDRTKTKLVVLNHGPLSVPFEIPWLRDILAAFDVTPADLINFARPTRFREIIVPAPAFEEGGFAHMVFGEICGRAGQRLVTKAIPNGRPVFLTKAGLSAGVTRILNEAELCRHLETLGVEIVMPERLSVKEQIKLFMERPVVAGMAGSAMHTAVFAAGRTKYEIHPTPFRLTNQILLDGVSGGQMVALYPRDCVRHEKPCPGFDSTFSLHDPQRVATDLRKIMDAGAQMFT